MGAKGQPPLLRAGGPGSQGAKGLLGPPRRAAGGMLRRKKFAEGEIFWRVKGISVLLVH